MRQRQLRFETLETRRVLSCLGGAEEAWDVAPVLEGEPQQAPWSSDLPLAASSQAAAATPTDWDQYLLELINRGRLDPLAEAARYGADLNQGLAPGTISSAPKQPLAFSPPLIAAARDHSQWMLDTNTFSHTGQGGSSPRDRMMAAGYQFVSPWGWAENLAYRGSSGPIEKTATTANLHSDLFLSPEHRKNQMNELDREVGLGVVQGLFTNQGTVWNALMATENFARSGSSVFLTGVVYDDTRVLSDAFYTPGEGLGGITIRATRQSDGQVFSTQTWTSGGYSLPLPSGSYLVAASGPLLGGSLAPAAITVSAQNVKLDFTAADNLVPTVTSLSLDSPTVIQPGSLTLTAIASDPDGQVVQVDFYRGTEWLGTDSDGSDGWTWSGSSAGWALGPHTLSARARDDSGAWSETISTGVVVHGQHAPIVFGPVLAFATAQQSFTLQNSGIGSITVHGSGLLPPFGISPAEGSGSSEDWIVPPGASKTYSVTYQPTEVGLHDAALLLTSDAAADGGYIVPITGSGVSAWQNAEIPHDVNGDGMVTALDVLMLINEINRNGSRALSEQEAGQPLFLDPDGNGYLTPADVLAVVNHINRGGRVPEGETAGPVRAASSG